jgi:TetR/AcrR family transcriptional regulator, ethionamide resistance regulator
VAATSQAARAGRQRRREEVQAKLRDALIELVQRVPFKDLTVDEIARGAGLSRSAFYFYFRDKHELLMVAAAEVADELFLEADRWWHGTGAPEALVREALQGVASVYARHARLLGVAVEVSTYDDEVRQFWRELVDRFVAATEDHIRREQAAGRMPGFDPRRTAEVLTWAAERYQWVYLRDGERTVDEVVDALAGVWMAALYPDRP